MGNYIIKNGNLVTKNGLINQNVFIKNGKIKLNVNGCANRNDYEEYKTINADNCFILPGGIDPHVHLNFNYNNRFTKHDAMLGGRIALLNGITTVYDFIIDEDGSISPKEAIEKRKEELKNIPINLKFHYCFNKEHDRVKEFIKELYDMDIDVIVFGFYKVWNENSLRKYLPLLKDRFWMGCHGLSINEQDIKIDKLTHRCLDMRETIDDIEEEIFLFHKKLAEEYNVPLYMFHMANPNLLEISSNIEIIKEVTHQHLFHSMQRALEDKYGEYMVCGPWLQTEEKRRSLLTKIKSITCIGSDDASFDIQDKEETGSKGNMIKGIPSLGYKLPMLYTLGIKNGCIDWKAALDLWSYNIANKLCSKDNKGNIEEGADADLVILEPGRIIRCDVPLDEGLNWYPFEYSLDGWPRDVFVCGKHMVENGQIKC